MDLNVDVLSSSLTFHGFVLSLKRWKTKHRTAWRTFWFIVFLLVCVPCAYYAFANITKYFRYPTLTRSRVSVTTVSVNTYDVVALRYYVFNPLWTGHVVLLYTNVCNNHDPLLKSFSIFLELCLKTSC